MTYAESLRKSVNTWSSAYLRFTTSNGTNDYIGYLFSEDEDDLIFYQHVLSNIHGLSYIGCGGKSGVLTVYRKLLQEGRSDGSLFIVDRDTDLEPFDGGSDVLRTAGYSWESHVSDPAFVEWIAQRRLNPSLTTRDAASLRENWVSTVESFREPLALHTALLRTALVLDTSLGMSSAFLTSGATLVRGVMVPGAEALQWHPAAMDRAIKAGALADDISRREERYRIGNLYIEAKGKVLSALLKEFIQKTLRELNSTFRGEYNSPKHLAAAMPWDFYSTNYIREYAIQRLRATT